jgi:hypothetical protein
MAIYQRANIPQTGIMTAGTDTSKDANINDELNGILSVIDGSGDYEAVMKQGATFNNSQGNFDVVVKGDTDETLLVTDADNNNVGIGTGSPTSKLHVDAKNDGAFYGYATFDSSSTTPANNDERYIDYKQKNDADSNVVYQRESFIAESVTAGAEKGTWELSTANGAGAITPIIKAGPDNIELNSGNTQINSGIITKTKSNSVTSTAGNEFVIFKDASAGPINEELPTAVGILGKIYKITKVDTTANIVLVTPNGSETINGGASYPLRRTGDSIELISDGSNWRTLAQVNQNITTASITSNQTIDSNDNDRLFIVDTTTGNVTLTLPPASSVGAGFSFKVHKAVNLNNLIFTPDGTETINGESSYTIYCKDSGASIVSNGSNWNLLLTPGPVLYEYEALSANIFLTDGALNNVLTITGLFGRKYQLSYSILCKTDGNAVWSMTFQIEQNNDTYSIREVSWTNLDDDDDSYSLISDNLIFDMNPSAPTANINLDINKTGSGMPLTVYGNGTTRETYLGLLDVSDTHRAGDLDA